MVRETCLTTSPAGLVDIGSVANDSNSLYVMVGFETSSKLDITSPLKY